jgi:hypothetical protein
MGKDVQKSFWSAYEPGPAAKPEKEFRAMTIFEHIAVFASRCEVIEFVPPNPGTPTQAAPGSPEKFLILCQRAERGEEIHVDGDRVDWSGMVGAVKPQLAKCGRRSRCEGRAG